MKKTLLTLAAALCIGTAIAATETDLTLVEGHTLLVAELDELGAADTDIVRFYIAGPEGASRNGWGIGGFANSDNWSPIVEWTGQEGGSWVQEHTVAEIKEVAGTEPGQYHGIGITINIYNDCSVARVTLVTEDDTPEPEPQPSVPTETDLTLVEGHTLLVADLDELGAVDTDIVRFYIAGPEGESRNGWDIGGFANSDNWSPIVAWTGQEGDSWVQEHTVAEIKEVAGTEPGQYHGIGITINIYNGCSVTRVTLVTEGGASEPEPQPSGDAVTVWEGDYTFDESWSGSISIGKLDVQAGDQLLITAEPVAPQSWEYGGQVFVKTLGAGWGAIAPTVAVGEAAVYTVTITDTPITVEGYQTDPYESDMVTELTTNGLVLQGIDAKVTKVELLKSTVVSLSEVKASVATGRLYNLAGQQVKAAKGLVISAGKVILVK